MSDSVRKTTAALRCGAPARGPVVGAYPSCSIAASTRRRVSGEMLGRPLSTLDAVDVDTWAAAATCSRVGRRGRVVGMGNCSERVSHTREACERRIVMCATRAPTSLARRPPSRVTPAVKVKEIVSYGRGQVDDVDSAPPRSKDTLVTTFHVAVTGSDRADGTPGAPFRTIHRAARAAMPGDTVRVHEGTYREWVRPVRGGVSDDRRITFEAAPGEHVAIKGSEVVTGWVREKGSVWRADVPNTLFGDFNPFAELVVGDWLQPGPGGALAHRGDVYLNGRSFHEVHDVADVAAPERRTHTRYPWTALDTELVEPDRTVYVWLAEVSDDVTTIWANFQDADPNAELVEINVRPAVFYPERSHLNYITVRGFELAQAATPWAPPTGDQPGLIGPNWAKGWIIEDNLIRDSKCSGVSLGKNAASGDNFGYERGDKPSYQYQIEAVFTAFHQGWDREHVGSHIVRRNEIRDCGQNGIVGHLGCVFSTIADNHIHHIGTKHEFYGYEIGGIKLHAPLDVEIVHNRIHDATLGIWLDWQVQGTRISRNLLYLS